MIASKTYTGLVVKLFEGRHADEIEQTAHRNRSILTKEEDGEHVYLLMNVVTRLPVDRLLSYDVLLDPVEERIDVRDSTLDLLDAMVNVAQDPDTDTDIPYTADSGIYSIATTVSDGMTPPRSWLDASKRTVQRALDDVHDAGSSRKATTSNSASGSTLLPNSVRG